jgi:hypothetical protein
MGVELWADHMRSLLMPIAVEKYGYIYFLTNLGIHLCLKIHFNVKWQGHIVIHPLLLEGSGLFLSQVHGSLESLLKKNLG